ncbi:MAG: methionyl-tRNA formyltransferase [Amphritea sp.]
MSNIAKQLRILFAGTPEFAASSLQALLDAGYNVIGVYTQPDRPAGRKRKLTPSPVKQAALKHDLPVYQPNSLKDTEQQDALSKLNADLMIVVAYGQILPKAVLQAPRLGCINVHASLLPRWRGAAPIERAMLAGDKTTGVTIMQMDEGLDTGAMLLTKECTISATQTGGELHDKLIEVGAAALLESLPGIADQSVLPVQQDDMLACYADKLEKAEGEIDWHRSAAEIALQIRSLCPRLVAYTTLKDETLRIWYAEPTDQAINNAKPGSIISTDKKAIYVACADTALKLLKIQLPGSKAMDTHAVLNAKRELFADGTQLG